MRRYLWFVFWLLAAIPAPLPAGAAVDAALLPSLNPMLERVSKGVVNISVRGTVEVTQNPLFRDPFFRWFFDMPQMPERRPTQSVGSGVIIDAGRGYVVTNHHVIQHADEIRVTLNDRRELAAELVGSDPETDVALLKVAPEDLTEVPFGDSDSLKIGDFVVAIGNPFGIGQTATFGIVSAVGRTGLGTNAYEDFIQTDASINPGNSGGALVNLRGELVGINTAILSRSGGNIGIGFAIPANMVRQVVAQLIEYGEVRRGQIGVLIQDVTPDLAAALGLERPEGALVSQVTPGSPADRAGLHAGDVVVALDGQPVRTSAELRNRVGLLRPDTRISLTFVRDGDRRTVALTLVEREAREMAGSSMPKRFEGVTLGPIPENHPLYGQVDGILVHGVDPASAAAKAGLRPGDIIIAVNQQPVASLAELAEIAARTGDRPLLLTVRRGQGALFLAIP